MHNTEHENGVLICRIHRTPISKSHGRFFCVKCQREPTALLRLKDNQWQVQWPEDNEFSNLVGWFETKTYEQTVEKLKSFPLNIGLKYKLIA